MQETFQLDAHRKIYLEHLYHVYVQQKIRQILKV